MDRCPDCGFKPWDAEGLDPGDDVSVCDGDCWEDCACADPCEACDGWHACFDQCGEEPAWSVETIQVAGGVL